MTDGGGGGSPQTLKKTVLATAREALWIVALSLALIFLASAISHALVLSPPARLPMTLVAAISSIVLLALAWWLRLARVPDRHVHNVGALIALIALGNEVTQQQLLMNPSLQKYTSIYLLAIGVFMLSTRNLLLCTTLALLAWGASVWRSAGDPEMVDWIYSHVTCAILAATLHVVRLRTLGRMEALRIAEARRTTDLQRALSELRSGESLFRQFADQSGQVFWINDAATHQVTYVNRVYEMLFGRPIGRLGNDPMDWLQAIHADDRMRVGQAYLDSLHTGVFEQEYRIVQSDGAVRWVHDHGFVISDEAGGVPRVGGITRDITDRVIARQELVQSEQTNRAMLHAIPDMILHIARDGTFLAVQNPKNFEALWVTPRQLGRNIRDLLPPELAKIGMAHLHAALTTGQVQTHEYAWQTGDREHWREWRIAPASEGEVLVIVRDITARKLAEEALRGSRQRLSDLIADIDGIVWECKPHSFGFTFVSARAEQMLGYPLEEWTSDENFFLRLLHPDDRDRIIGFCAQRADMGLDFEMDYRVLAADGRVLWIHDKVRVVMNEQGKPERLCGLLIDITDSMRAAQALRDSQVILDKAQEIASLGSWSWDAARDRVTWSPQMYRIHGITPAEFDGTWSRAFELVHPDDQPRVWRIAERALASGDVETFEYRVLRPDGGERIVTADGQIQYGEQGEVERVIGTVQDITEVRRAQAERQRLEDELKQAQKLEAVGTLATGVAHDFNNLLTAINGYVSLTRDALAPDSKARQTLDMIELATEQAAGVTHSLLTFGHRTPTEKSAIDLAPNIRQSLQLLRRLLPASIELVEDLPENDEIFVNANGHQLQQVWLNLTINARDAMPDGGRLIIRLRRHAQPPEPPESPDLPEPPESASDSWYGQPAESALITVTDNGAGMDEKVMRRIFEPYFTTKPRGQGTGLGLSIVHGIITDHGGRIRVRSQPGRSTRFIIHLPTCPPPAAAVPPTVTDDLHRGHGQTILLAEDNEFVRAIIASSLQAAGYRIIHVGDGRQALNIYEARREELGLLLLDLDLPRFTGEQCLEQIRRTSPDLPVILISGAYDQTTRIDAPSTEVRLAKPFQITTLIELVNLMLAKTRAR